MICRNHAAPRPGAEGNAGRPHGPAADSRNTRGRAKATRGRVRHLPGQPVGKPSLIIWWRSAWRDSFSISAAACTLPPVRSSAAATRLR